MLEIHTINKRQKEERLHKTMNCKRVSLTVCILQQSVSQLMEFKLFLTHPVMNNTEKNNLVFVYILSLFLQDKCPEKQEV